MSPFAGLDPNALYIPGDINSLFLRCHSYPTPFSHDGASVLLPYCLAQYANILVLLILTMYFWIHRSHPTELVCIALAFLVRL